MNKDELGRRLKEARDKSGLTQAEASIAMGWGENNSTLSNYECGRREPDIARLSKMLDLYGTSLKEFFSGEALESVKESKRVPLSVVRSVLDTLLNSDEEGRKIMLDKLKI